MQGARLSCTGNTSGKPELRTSGVRDLLLSNVQVSVCRVGTRRTTYQGNSGYTVLKSRYNYERVKTRGGGKT